MAYFLCPFQIGDELRVFYPDLGLDHFGIVYQVLSGWNGWLVRVIHNSKHGGGVCIVTLDEFSCGNEIFINRRAISEAHRQAIIARAVGALGHPYGVLENCEHFTTWCYTGIAESRQLQNAVLAAGVTLGLGLALASTD